MERFAVGINKKVFDFNIFKRTAGATLTVWWYNKLINFIDHFRTEYKNKETYKDLKKLVDRLKEQNLWLF